MNRYIEKIAGWKVPAAIGMAVGGGIGAASDKAHRVRNGLIGAVAGGASGIGASRWKLHAPAAIKAKLHPEHVPVGRAGNAPSTGSLLADLASEFLG